MGAAVMAFERSHRNAPTRHIFFPLWTDPLALECGQLVGYEAFHRPADPSARHAFVTFDSLASARAALAALARFRPSFANSLLERADLVSPTQAASPLSVPCTPGAAASVPGLFLVADFVDDATEAACLVCLDGRHWEPLKQRRVQHYGHAFIYSLMNVDLSRNTAAAIPSELDSLRVRLEELYHQFTQSSIHLDQLTANDYPPKIGIAAHVDTHSAFRDGIISVSLGSSSVMVMRNLDDPSVAHAIFLPRRSALFLTGPARYSWSHGIASRTVDVDADGVAHDRGRRVSLTWRAVLGRPCTCPYARHCDSQRATATQHDGERPVETAEKEGLK